MEVLYSSVALMICPFVAYFAVQNQQWIVDAYGWEKANALAALAAVAAVQAVIWTIIIIKYWEDFMIVFRGQGHLPYDESLKKDSEYFQSDQYQKDIKADDHRREKRRKTIEKAKKKTE